LFVAAVPSSLALRIWDALVTCGRDVIVAVALAILMQSSQAICAREELDEVADVIRERAAACFETDAVFEQMRTLLSSGRIANARARRLGEIRARVHSAEMKSLLADTELDAATIGALHDCFASEVQAAGGASVHDCGIDRRAFARLLASRGFEHSESWTERLFTAFDANKDGKVDFRELCLGLSIFGRSNFKDKEKLHLCFKAFDLNGDETLSREEFRHAFEIIWRAVYSEEPAVKYIDWLFEQADADHDGRLTEQEFSSICSFDLVIAQFLRPSDTQNAREHIAL